MICCPYKNKKERHVEEKIIQAQRLIVLIARGHGSRGFPFMPRCDPERTGSLSGKTQDWAKLRQYYCGDAAYSDTTANHAAFVTLFETARPWSYNRRRLHIKPL